MRMGKDKRFSRWRWLALLLLLGLVVFAYCGYAHLTLVQAKRLTVRGKPAVQLLIQTDQGGGREVIVQVGSNVITFRTDPRGKVDTGRMEIPPGATTVVVKMPDPGDELWPAECAIPLAEIPQGRYQRVTACMDLEPPVTRFSQEPEPTDYGWNNSPVRVTLEATDAKSGVGQICYELSGAITQGQRCVTGAEASFTIGTSPNGTTTVRFFAEDRWVDRGTPKPNRESTKEAVVRIDTGRPSISASLFPEPNEHGWNNEPVRVDFHCSDPLSDIASCTGDRTVSTEGKEQSVTGHAEDRAGNANSMTVYVSIDLTKPVIRQTGSATCSRPGEGGWCRGEVTVTFEASDELSGFAGDQHTIRLTRSTSQEGDSVWVTAAVEDLAGNRSETRAGPFKIDKTSPQISLSAASPAPGQPAVVSWKISDGLSGVDPGSCLVTLSGPGITGAGDRATLSQSCEGHVSLAYERYGAGTFTVRAQARDLAGNEGADSVEFVLHPSLIPPGTPTHFTWTDPGTKDQLEIEVRITPQSDNLWKWEYIVTNLSYDPPKGNGFSGFNIVFAELVDELSGQFGPSGWEMNCCSPKGPPAGAEWDKESGTGVKPGEQAVFGFFTYPREVLLVQGEEPLTTSWAHTWVQGDPAFIFTGDLLVPGRLK